MDYLPTLANDDWWNLFLNVVAGLIVAILLWLFARLLWFFIGSGERLSPLGDTKDITRPVIALPKPTTHYVADKDLILQIYRAMKDRNGATISGLSGMGGIGKTEAAVVATWHLLKDGRFKDGAVLIDLHGFADAEKRRPMEPREALNSLLIKITGNPMIGDFTDEDLASKWQNVTAGKDLLVILDNARNDEQVKPLMPAANGPKVLVTSRNKVQLPGGQPPIEVGKLDQNRAAKLARELAPGLSDKQIARLIRLSLGLPLLLRTIAATVQRQEKVTDAWLTEFEELGAATEGEDIVKLRERLAFSIDALGEDDATRYAALSLCPAGFHAQTAYAIWGLEESPGADALRRLRDANLLEEDESPFGEMLGPRYVLHDYLADSARERFDKLHWKTRQGYEHRWGQHAMALLSIADQLFQTKGGDLAGLRLFEMEQATIRAAQAWTVERAEVDDTAADLSMRFPNFALLSLRLTPREQIGWLEAGLPAAQRLGDRTAEAALLGNVGHRYQSLGEFETAEARLTASLAIQTERGNRLSMARQHGNLGGLYLEMGDVEQAERSFKASLELSTALSQEAAERGDHDSQRESDVSTANTQGNLGIVYKEQEKYAEAEQSYRASLEIERRLGRREGMAHDLGNLGVLYRRQGRLDDAAVAFEQSLEITDEIGAKAVSANQRFNLALLRLQQGRVAQARDHARAARALYAEVGMDHHVADADALLAEIDQAGG